jgi:hypothetical protein
MPPSRAERPHATKSCFHAGMLPRKAQEGPIAIAEGDMLKQLLITTAAVALAAGNAVAQAPQPSKRSTSGRATAQKQLAMQEAPNQVLASQIEGTDVVDANNQTIGSVTNVLFDKNGNVLAYVIGMGGFFGLGSKDVAINPSAFHAGSQGKRELKLAMSKDDLRTMPEFKPYQEPGAISTVGKGSTMAPPGGAPAPHR